MEELKTLNNRLIDYYGYFNGKEPNWRVVFSDNELEKRWVTHTAEGIELLHPEVAERPKYRHYITAKHILERIMPIHGATDLIGETSYEPVFVFKDENNEALPPIWPVIEIVINSIYERSAQAVNAIQAGRQLYKHPMHGMNTEEQLEFRRLELEEIKKYFYSNETTTGDALATKNAVIVPRNYETTH